MFSVISSHQYNFFLDFVSLESTASVLCHQHSRGYLLSDSTCNFFQEAFKSAVMQAIISWKYAINAPLNMQYVTNNFLQKVISAPLVGIQQRVGRSPRPPCIYIKFTCGEFNRTVLAVSFFHPSTFNISSPSNGTFHMFYPLPRMWTCCFPACYRDM